MSLLTIIFINHETKMVHLATVVSTYDIHQPIKLEIAHFETHRDNITPYVGLLHTRHTHSAHNKCSNTQKCSHQQHQIIPIDFESLLSLIMSMFSQKSQLGVSISEFYGRSFDWPVGRKVTPS
jgi:hypothetical protein